MLRSDNTPQTLRDVIVDRSRTDPDRLAYDDGSRTATFGELGERAAAGAALLASKGVKPGDRVALVLPAGVEFAEAFWAVQMLGATSCAFNPGLPARTIERRAARIRPRLVVTEGMIGSAAPVRDMPDEPPIGGGGIALFPPPAGTPRGPPAAVLR